MSSTNLMSKADEARILAMVEGVISAVNDGVSPTAALDKVAADDESTHVIRRVGELYNQSRTLFNLTDPDERGGVFPLADPDAVIDGRAAKRAAASRGPVGGAVRTPRLYDRWAAPSAQPVATKAASERSELAAEPVAGDSGEAERERAAVREAVLREMCKVAEGLRAVFLEDGFHAVEAALLSKRGEGARPALDLAWQLSRAEKFGQRRAEAHDVSRFTLVDLGALSRGQLASIERLFDLSLDYQRKAAQARKMAQPRKLAGEVKAASAVGGEVKSATGVDLWQSVRDINSSLDDLADASMSAVRGAGTWARESLANLGGGDGPVGKPVGKAPQSDQSVLSTGAQLEDPALDRSLQEIRVRAGLSDLMANDEVISGYSDDEVVDAFNQVAAAAPSAVENRAVLRDLLRRALTGGISSFDIQQAAGLSAELDKARAGGNAVLRGDLPSDIATGWLSNRPRGV